MGGASALIGFRWIVGARQMLTAKQPLRPLLPTFHRSSRHRVEYECHYGHLGCPSRPGDRTKMHRLKGISMTPDTQSPWPHSVWSRIDFSCRTFIVTWTAVSAIVLDSISLHATALYMVAILALYTSSTKRRKVPSIDARPRLSSRIWLLTILLAPSPFLIGAGVHRLNHVQPPDPTMMLLASSPALMYGVVHMVLRFISARNTRSKLAPSALIMALPFAAPALTSACLALGFGVADAALCLLLMLVLLFGVLGRYVAQFGQILD